MKYKAIITDLDGTAIDSPSQTAATRRLSKAVSKLQEKEVKVCAATGRSLNFASKTLHTMGIKDPVIVSAGTRIVNPLSRQELWSYYLSSQQIEQILAVLKDYDYKILWNDYEEDDYMQKEGFDVSEYDKNLPTYFLQVCYLSEHKADEVAGKLEKIESITVEKPTALKGKNLKDLHVMRSNTTKENAVYALAKILGIKPNECIGIGDGSNDVKMFEAVGYKVAMSNAVEELKQEADEIIGDIRDDGLAEYFEKLAKELE